MHKILFLASTVLFCFIDDCHSFNTLQTPDMSILVTTFKNATGQCSSKIGVDFFRETVGTNYHIDISKSYIDDYILNQANIFVVDDRPAGSMVLQQFTGAGYKLYQDFGFYKFHTTPLLWADARTKCAEEGAHLLIINSQKEADVVMSIFRQYMTDDVNNKVKRRNYVFVGFHDLFKEGQYLTHFGTPLADTGFMKWSPNEPNNDGEEDCGTIYKDGLYNDFPCYVEAPFICKKRSEYVPVDIDVRSN